MKLKFRFTNKQLFNPIFPCHNNNHMEYLCLDIKYVWIAGEKQYYYLLTNCPFLQFFQYTIKSRSSGY